MRANCCYIVHISDYIDKIWFNFAFSILFLSGDDSSAALQASGNGAGANSHGISAISSINAHNSNNTSSSAMSRPLVSLPTSAYYSTAHASNASTSITTSSTSKHSAPGGVSSSGAISTSKLLANQAAPISIDRDCMGCAGMESNAHRTFAEQCMLKVVFRDHPFNEVSVYFLWHRK
jgi:hypothetical protein